MLSPWPQVHTDQKEKIWPSFPDSVPIVLIEEDYGEKSLGSKLQVIVASWIPHATDPPYQISFFGPYSHKFADKVLLLLQLDLASHMF